MQHILKGNSHPSITHVHIPRHAYRGPLLTIPPTVPPARITRASKEWALAQAEMPPDPTMVLPVLITGRVPAAEVERYRVRRPWRVITWAIEGAFLVALVAVTALLAASFA